MTGEMQIQALFFKGNKHMASNYRLISLTSVCCKTLEHIICKHMLNHLEKHKIASSLQHEFRSGNSYESQLILAMNDMIQNFDSKQQTDLIILDFSKAFDTVPHRKRLFKLGNMVSLVILTSGFSLSWCIESNKLLLKVSPLSHAPLSLEYLKVLF